MWFWVNEFLNRREYERERQRAHELDLRVCNACETLKLELARSADRERQLLNLLNKPTTESEIFESKAEIKPKFKPWSVQRQELERKTRVPKISIETLDKELDEVRK